MRLWYREVSKLEQQLHFQKTFSQQPPGNLLSSGEQSTSEIASEAATAIVLGQREALESSLDEGRYLLSFP